MLLWVIFRANTDSEGFLSVSMVPSFAQRGGADCCVGSRSVSEGSTGCLTWDVGYWHIVTGGMLGGIYVVWMPMCVSGDCGSSMCSWDRLTTPLEASFLPAPEREPRCWFDNSRVPGGGWNVAILTYLWGKYWIRCLNYILNLGAGRGIAARRLSCLPLPWGWVVLCCSYETRETWKGGRVCLTLQ